MNPWIAKAVLLAASITMVIIRAPHGQRSRGVKVARSRRGPLEAVLLTLAWVSFFVPLVWVATPLLRFADYPLRALPLVAGAACLAAGLWLFARSHADLGTNWSITLEVREEHRLITSGVYRSIRHPMYSSLLLYSVGQALAVPNWIAGPSYGVAMLLLVALRLGPEERMMLEQFGPGYEEYRARTRRLIPGIW
jgi:protein-S-isoprenylcysteine O-methyltransferase Ste14